MFAKALWAVIPMAATIIAAPVLAQEEPPTMTSQVLGSYVIPEVNQAIGVDAEHFTPSITPASPNIPRTLRSGWR